MKQKVMLLCAVCVLVVALAVPTMAADKFPSKPITLYSPYATGGAIDMTLRLLGQELEKKLGVPVLIESKSGGGGAVALNAIKRAKPDGYTLCGFADSMIMVKPILDSVDYDPLNDFRFVNTLVNAFHPLAIRSNSEWETLDDMIAWAKANPGKLKWAPATASNMLAFVGMKFFKEAGIEATIVPFNGGAEANAALLGGHIDATIIAESLSPYKAGEIRILAETTPVSNPFIPGVKTLKELGYDTGFSIFYGLLGPKDLPDDIVNFLSKEIDTILKSETFLNGAGNINTVPVSKNGEELLQYYRDNIPVMEAIIEEFE